MVKQTAFILYGDIERNVELLGVIRLHFLKTENIQHWLHLAALHLQQLGVACFSDDFTVLVCDATISIECLLISSQTIIIRFYNCLEPAYLIFVNIFLFILPMVYALEINAFTYIFHTWLQNLYAFVSLDDVPKRLKFSVKANACMCIRLLVYPTTEK